MQGTSSLAVCELFFFYLRVPGSIIRSCNFKLSVVTVIYTYLQICIISIFVRVEIIIFCCMTHPQKSKLKHSYVTLHSYRLLHSSI